MRARAGFLLGVTIAAGTLGGSSGARPAYGQAPGINLGLAAADTPLVDGAIAAFSVRETSQRADLNGDGDQLDVIAHVFDARSGSTRNLGLAVLPQTMLVTGEVVVLRVPEDGRDLNGDGDGSDEVLHTFDSRSGALRNLRLAVREFPDPLVLDGRRFPFTAIESAQGGRDLNGDGDAEDGVVHYLELATGAVVNTGLAARFESTDFAGLELSPQFITLGVDERLQGGRDLNGDGDLDDLVAHVFDTELRRATSLGIAGLGQIVGQTLLIDVSEGLESEDLNGDGDLADSIVHVADLRSGAVRNSRLAGAGGGFVDRERGIAVFAAIEFRLGAEFGPGRHGVDLNGDGDPFDFVPHLLDGQTGEVRSLGIASSWTLLMRGGRAVALVDELENGRRDLNGNGIVGDRVLVVVDVERRQVVSTGFAAHLPRGPLVPSQLVRDALPLLVDEGPLGARRDLNGDGDALDFVLQVVSVSEGTVVSSGLESSTLDGGATFLPNGIGRVDGRFVVPVLEAGQGGRDLNGDGDADDAVLHIFDTRLRAATNLNLPVQTFQFFFPTAQILAGKGFVSVGVPEAASARDLNGDGDALDDVLHLVDIATGTVANARLAVQGLDLFAGLPIPVSIAAGSLEPASPRAGGAYVFLVPEASQGGRDLNGDGDSDDLVVHATRLVDEDQDGRFDFADDRVDVPPLFAFLAFLDALRALLEGLGL
jgi:hypothetical protein